jgi:flagellar biosynthesis/type III secretory pathway protein FliH
MISKSPEDLQYYEDRLKFLRDEAAKLDAAREEGLEEGEQIGIGKGVRLGKLTARIQTLQELLGEQVSMDEELLLESIEALTSRLESLQTRLNRRG